MRLVGGISAAATSLIVDTTTGLPAVPFTLMLEPGATVEEIVTVTAVGGTTLTATRGVGGTSAQIHLNGVEIRHAYYGQDFQDSRNHEANAAIHGTTYSFTFSTTGILAVADGKSRIYNDTGATLTITSTRASVDAAPTGAAVIVTVKKNGTSIWSVTPANRPTIAASTNTAPGGTPDTASWANGEYLTADVTQAGSVIAGSDLTVQVLAK